MILYLQRKLQIGKDDFSIKFIQKVVVVGVPTIRSSFAWGSVSGKGTGGNT